MSYYVFGGYMYSYRFYRGRKLVFILYESSKDLAVTAMFNQFPFVEWDRVIQGDEL